MIFHTRSNYAYPECPISRINQIVWKLVDSGVLIFTQDRTFQRKKAQVSKNTKTRTALKQVGILDGVVIEGTDKITTYLDEKFPDMNAAGFLDRETREVVLQIRMKCLELEHLAIDLANAPNKR